MLRRLGNKSKLLPKLLPLFPENITTFIDMFMGSGAVTFAMVDRCNHIIANDKDEEVFNLFMVLKEHREELTHHLKIMPAHEGLYNFWKASEESDPIWKASRFLMLSNAGYLGADGTFAFKAGRKPKKNMIDHVENMLIHHEIQFMGCDFREVLSKISWSFEQRPNNKNHAFAYADPPYLGTANNYQESFTEDDTRDLFSILTSSGLRFAVSEFRHPLVMALAEEHGLHVTSLGERRNLKNRREEIVITNYQPERRQGSLFPSMGTAASPANASFQQALAVLKRGVSSTFPGLRG